jgi:hypothetical protein
MQTASSDYDNIYQPGRAVSLLRKKAVDLPSKAPAPTLFEKLVQTASEQLSFEEVDRTYRQIYQRGDKRMKPVIVISYLESFPKQAAKSKWLKGIIFDSTSTSRKQPRPRGDKTKEIIAQIKARNPGISALEICDKVDAQNIPIRHPWQWKGNRTWRGAYLNPSLTRRVKTYISKIASQPRY